jgi:hypothetical protein
MSKVPSETALISAGQQGHLHASLASVERALDEMTALVRGDDNGDSAVLARPVHDLPPGLEARMCSTPGRRSRP